MCAAGRANDTVPFSSTRALTPATTPDTDSANRAEPAVVFAPAPARLDGAGPVSRRSRPGAAADAHEDQEPHGAPFCPALSAHRWIVTAPRGRGRSCSRRTSTKAAAVTDHSVRANTATSGSCAARAAAPRPRSPAARCCPARAQARARPTRAAPHPRPARFAPCHAG